MSVGEDRLALGAERREIFINYCNQTGQGYQPERVKKILAEEYGRSPEGVWREIQLVANKIRDYRHRRCVRPAAPRPGTVEPHLGMLPPVPCETEAEITANRRPLLDSLDFITDQNLSSELLHIPNLKSHTIENMTHLRDAAHAVQARVTEVK